MKKYIAILIFFIGLFINNNNLLATNQDTAQIENFVNNLAVKFDKINVIKDKKKQKNEALLLSKEVLDIKWMGNFILGKHKKTLSNEQFQEFIDVFSEFLLQTYMNTLMLFSSKTLTIKEIYPQKENVYFVKIEIKVDSTLVKSSLRIVKKDNKYLITDIIAENVSFINAKREEINSVISQNGFDQLIKDIKLKIVK